MLPLSGPPPPEAPGRTDEKTKRPIARINEISTLARTSWIGLLAYLAFVFVTLLGVQDADFFVPSRQTQLPLVNVSIPTASFFYFAPVLASALFIYLHLFLLKLWDAIAEVDHRVDGQPLGDVIHPWLVNTLATSMIGGSARSERPLDWLSNVVTALLVWVAGPFVIAWAWWRSMPAHDEMLTGTIALALLASLLACAASWWRARARLRFFAADTWEGWWKWAGAAIVALTIASLTWLRTEDGLDELFPSLERSWQSAWLNRTAGWTLLAPTDLAGQALGATPSGWYDHDIARRRHRENWCARREIALTTCDLIATDMAAAANTWCTGDPHPKRGCANGFAELVTRFEEEWRIDRTAYLTDLSVPDLAARDLRGANLAGTFLPGADLRFARLEGAILSEARMAGADFHLARLQRANLSGAWLEGVDLSEARLQEARLVGARLDGVDFSGARLDGVDFRGARMEGVDLGFTRLEGADLFGADLRSAEWAGSQMGALAHSADLRDGRALTQDLLDQMIGNAETLLPETLDDGTVPSLPACWAAPPPFFEAMVDRMSSGSQDIADNLRAEFICPERAELTRTGMPLALDAPYPAGHPLADRDD